MVVRLMNIPIRAMQMLHQLWLFRYNIFNANPYFLKKCYQNRLAYFYSDQLHGVVEMFRFVPNSRKIITSCINSDCL